MPFPRLCTGGSMMCGQSGQCWLTENFYLNLFTYSLQASVKVLKSKGGGGEGTSNELGIICPLPTHPD